MSNSKERKQEAMRNKVHQQLDGDAVTKGNMGSEKLTETYSEKQKEQLSHERARNHPAADAREPEGGVSEVRNTRRSQMEKITEKKEGKIVARNSGQMAIHDELSDERETDL
jgi:hypothetical protein